MTMKLNGSNIIKIKILFILKQKLNYIALMVHKLNQKYKIFKVISLNFMKDS